MLKILWILVVKYDISFERMMKEFAFLGIFRKALFGCFVSGQFVTEYKKPLKNWTTKAASCRQCRRKETVVECVLDCSVVPCIVAGLPLSLLWQSVTEDLFTNSTFLFLPILILAWFITLNFFWVWKGDPPWCGRNRSFTNFVQKIGLKSAILSPTNKNEIILRSALWPQFLKVSLLLTCSLKNLGENF